jgi:hypothetical protein
MHVTPLSMGWQQLLRSSAGLYASMAVDRCYHWLLFSRRFQQRFIYSTAVATVVQPRVLPSLYRFPLYAEPGSPDLLKPVAIIAGSCSSREHTVAVPPLSELPHQRRFGTMMQRSQTDNINGSPGSVAEVAIPKW